jgi:hypothetical protein
MLLAGFVSSLLQDESPITNRAITAIIVIVLIAVFLKHYYWCSCPASEQHANRRESAFRELKSPCKQGFRKNNDPAAGSRQLPGGRQYETGLFKMKSFVWSG